MTLSGSLILLAIAVALVTAAILLIPDGSAFTFTARPVPSKTFAEKPGHESDKAKRVALTSKNLRRRDTSPRSENSAETSPLNIPVYEEVVTMSPFPTAEAVQRASSRADVLRSFGPPDVTVLSGSRERLLYLGRSRATSVVLNNGTIAGSRTDQFDVTAGSVAKVTASQ
jgi:hypothetical protein